MLLALHFKPIAGSFSLRKNLLGSKRKAINIYFAFILEVLQVGKQFAAANSLFISICCIKLKSIILFPEK